MFREPVTTAVYSRIGRSPNNLAFNSYYENIVVELKN